MKLIKNLLLLIICFLSVNVLLAQDNNATPKSPKMQAAPQSPQPVSTINQTFADLLLVEKLNNASIVYVIDGQRVTFKEIETLNPDNISSVEVLKNENAQKMFGEDVVAAVIITCIRKK